MIKFPKTTYTFSSYTYDEETGDSSETKVEFTTEQETISEILEKMADFLRGSGFGYVESLDWESAYKDNAPEYEDSQPDTSLDFSSPYPDSAWAQTNPLPYNVSYGDASPYNVSCGDVNIRTSIDECTPEEWNAASRNVRGY